MNKSSRSRRKTPAAAKPPSRPAARTPRGSTGGDAASAVTVVNSRLPEKLMRYHRQMILPAIGRPGQERLGRATAAVVGLGALGTVSADFLARAGVGRLILVDRDCLEITNLQRQVLYTEADARERKPKAVAAAERLREVNSEIDIEPRVQDLDAARTEALVREVDLIVDGSDNFETRYVLNDACVKNKKPWVYGAAVGSAGLCMCIVPGRTPCLRCLFEDPPPQGTAPTCDTVGVLGPVTGVIGAWQAGEAIKLLSGNLAAISPRLLSIDLWSDQFRGLNTGETRRANCPCCGKHQYEFLSGR
ncbi:MAG TPA: ThiF family adenylyltransferase, partial [Planctomycetota bacterium]|nr:ThiF family adenylyltransferase [Planctomycetota bacterium]